VQGGRPPSLHSYSIELEASLQAAPVAFSLPPMTASKRKKTTPGG
jgi:hypothetical protein